MALWLSMLALFAGPALADNTGNGSKNFRPPATVPNYFSNEAGPMLGGPAESRRVDLYSNPGTAPRQVDTVTAPPSARYRHVAAQHGRIRLAAQMRGGRLPAAVRGHTRTHLAARGGPPSHAKHAVVSSRGTRISSVHHRGRG
jgi:hypothetical protein